MTPREHKLEAQVKIYSAVCLFVMGQRDRALGIPPQQDNDDYLLGYELEETNHAPMRLNS